MSFSVALLTTQAECDEALAYAQSELRDLTYRQTVYTHAAENTAETATSVAAALASANAEIAFLTPLVASLPESEEKRKRTTELRRATDRRDNLADRRTGRPVDALTRELEKAQVEAQLATTTAFVAEVQAHRATLPA